MIRGALLGWAVAATLCLATVIVLGLPPIAGGCLGLVMGSTGILLGDELERRRG